MVQVVQKTLTLTFWVYSNKTGTYCVQIEHDDASKYNMYEYTINSFKYLGKENNKRFLVINQI